MGEKKRKKRRIVSPSVWITLGVSVFLLAAGGTIGGIMTARSIETTRDLLNGKMLDIASSAVAMLDGDVVASLTHNDLGGEVFFLDEELQKPADQQHSPSVEVQPIAVADALLKMDSFRDGVRSREKYEVTGVISSPINANLEGDVISFNIAETATSEKSLYLSEITIEPEEKDKFVVGKCISVTGFLENAKTKEESFRKTLFPNSQAYDNCAEILSTFRTSAERSKAEFAYIYLVKKLPDGRFVFSVDPSDDPGVYMEEETISTAALDEAYTKKIPTYDLESYQDRWGRYYTAYCPVLDSHGDVASVVAVDINAGWYESTIRDALLAVIPSTLTVVVLGVLLSLLINWRLGARLKAVNNDMDDLREDVQELLKSMKSDGVLGASNVPEEKAANLGVLRDRIRATQQELKQYIEYAKEQAFIDGLTGLGNRSAYLNQIKAMNNDFTKNFSVIVLDINGLKSINDIYGHEEGDRSIIATATCIKKACEGQLVYRIGGDEFVVILNYSNKEKIESASEVFKEAIAAYNVGEDKLPFELSVSTGYSCVNFESDTAYVDVFKRADEAMYKVKKKYYEHHKQ